MNENIKLIHSAWLIDGAYDVLPCILVLEDEYLKLYAAGKGNFWGDAFKKYEKLFETRQLEYRIEDTETVELFNRPIEKFKGAKFPLIEDYSELTLPFGRKTAFFSFSKPERTDQIHLTDWSSNQFMKELTVKAEKSEQDYTPSFFGRDLKSVFDRYF